MSGRVVDVAPGVAVWTDAPESPEERAHREAVEARRQRAKEVADALRAGPFPMTLTQWARSASLRSDEEHRDGGQITFLRDRLMHAVCETDAEAAAYRPHNDGDPGVTSRCTVIGTHTSKSCVLPVVHIGPLGLGWTATLRGNFHNWKVSVTSYDGPVDIDHGMLFRPADTIHPAYCEGFPEDYVFGSYAADRSRFTVEVYCEHEVFTLMYLLSRWSRRTK